jgi:hypothetical protein
MNLNCLLGNILGLLLVIYAVLLMLFREQAGEKFGQIMRGFLRVLKFVCTILLKVLRALLKDIVTVLDAILEWLKGK